MTVTSDVCPCKKHALAGPTAPDDAKRFAIADLKRHITQHRLRAKTAQHGGDMNCGGPSGCGTLFELPATGGFIVLHTFKAGVDGAFPSGAVVKDKEGKLYGVTQGDGDPQCGCVTCSSSADTATLARGVYYLPSAITGIL